MAYLNVQPPVIRYFYGKSVPNSYFLINQCPYFATCVISIVFLEKTPAFSKNSKINMEYGQD
jgi:hypothetical protein